MEKQLNIHPYPLLKIPPKIADQCRTAVCAVYLRWCARLCGVCGAGGLHRNGGVDDVFLVGKVAPVYGLLRAHASAARVSRFDVA